MILTFTTTPDALSAAARILLHSVERGDFDADPDIEDAAVVAAGRFQTAARTANDNYEIDAEVTVDTDPLDEILAVLESDPVATGGTLARFLLDANTALAATPAVNP